MTMDNKWNKLVSKEEPLKLHPRALEILYEHRHYISKVFREIISFSKLDLEHVAIYLMNPADELVVFSLTPNIEFNLINLSLLQHDEILSLRFHKEGGLYWWDKELKENFYFDRVRYFKQIRNYFSLGFTLAKKVENFCLLYSFATCSEEKERKDYLDRLGTIERMGDLCYGAIREIYRECCGEISPPVIEVWDQKELEFVAE